MKEERFDKKRKPFACQEKKKTPPLKRACWRSIFKIGKRTKQGVPIPGKRKPKTA
jgi:hypothetical protein